MGKVIGLIAIKGGVGKTTLSAALASELASHHSKKVLLVDANYSAPNLGLHMDIIEPTASIQDVLSGKSSLKGAIHQRYGVDVIPGSYLFDKDLNTLRLKERLDKVKGDYDFVVLDSSPSLNDEILSTIIASDHLFVVSTPDYPTLSCSLRAAQIAKKKGKPIEGIIINKIRDPHYELSLREIEEVSGIPVVARIRDDKHAVRALHTRIPLPIYNRNSAISREISKLSSSLTFRKQKQSILRKVFGLKMSQEEVNRQLLKERFYISMFDQ